MNGGVTVPASVRTGVDQALVQERIQLVDIGVGLIDTAIFPQMGNRALAQPRAIIPLIHTLLREYRFCGRYAPVWGVR